MEKKIDISTIKTPKAMYREHQHMWRTIIAKIIAGKCSRISNVKYKAVLELYDKAIWGSCWGCMNWKKTGRCLFNTGCGRDISLCCNGAWNKLRLLDLTKNKKEALCLAHEILNFPLAKEYK